MKIRECQQCVYRLDGDYMLWRACEVAAPSRGMSTRNTVVSFLREFHRNDHVEDVAHGTTMRRVLIVEAMRKAQQQQRQHEQSLAHDQ
jgi:hypothetical protein